MNTSWSTFRKEFYRRWESVFGYSQRVQIEAMETIMNLMETNDKDSFHVLVYQWATIHWETNKTFKPVKEAYYLSEAWRKKNLRYYPWYGRGYVQLTWEANYKKASEALGIDFIENPDLTMQPANAYEILARGMREGWFGTPIGRWINDKRVWYRAARRSVNAMDHATDIAQLAKKYETIMTDTWRNNNDSLTSTSN